MSSPSTDSTDGLGGEKIIYNHFGLKPQTFPCPTNCFTRPTSSLNRPARYTLSSLRVHDRCLATLVSMVVKKPFSYLGVCVSGGCGA